MKKQLGQRLSTPKEGYRHIYKGFRDISSFRKATKTGQLNEQFKERIMLAVTEVNGCPLCAYGHTQIALESGMTLTEIEGMLAGQMGAAPKEELVAILFAQHYADLRGNPTQASWQKLQKVYGDAMSQTILSTIRIIMVGNTYGIPLGSLRKRLKRQEQLTSDPRSSLPYELTMLSSLLFFLPVGFVHAKLATGLNKELLTFAD